MASLRMDTMDENVTQITMNGKLAYSLPEFPPARDPARWVLQLKYELEKRDGFLLFGLATTVKSRMGELTMLNGHPDESGGRSNRPSRDTRGARSGATRSREFRPGK